MSSANLPPGDLSPTQSSNDPTTWWASYDSPTDPRPSYQIPVAGPTYIPTPEQLARDEMRRRYLRRNVYAPIIAAAVIFAALLILIIILAFGFSTPQVASFITGMSALIVIMFSIPIIILMALMPITWLALAANRRQQRANLPKTGPMAYRGRLLTLLWQIDGLLIALQRGVEGVGEQLRRPLIALHARFAYIRGWLNGIMGKRYTE